MAIREHSRTSPAARFRACSIPVADRVPITIRGGLDGLSDEPRPSPPRRSETFQLSTDSFFIDKVRDVVGFYLDPPERALVLCVDEKERVPKSCWTSSE